MKKIILTLLSLLLCATFIVGLASCNGTTTTTTNPTGTTGADGDYTEPDTPSDKVNVKFFKVGKANATLIRSGDIAILIDTGENEDEDENGKYDDAEKILAYLTEKGVADIDYLIVSQFNKNHSGGVKTILENITVKNVIEPDYTKIGNAYDEYRASLQAAGITPVAVTETKEIKAGGLALTLYPAKEASSTANQDEYYSLAVAVDSDGLDILITSDIVGARITDLIAKLGGKKFDIVQMPNHGEYSNQVEELVNACAPSYAVIFSSKNNPADTRLTNFLTGKSITTYLTMNGSVEAKLKDGELTVKQ